MIKTFAEVVDRNEEVLVATYLHTYVRKDVTTNFFCRPELLPTMNTCEHSLEVFISG